MFTQADAQTLRAALSPIQFRAEDSTRPAAALESYCAHYGLQFSTPDRPVAHRLGTFSTAALDGHYELVCQYFALPVEQERGTAILLHGYFDHVGLYGHLIRHCLELGLSVVIFDLPGHGLSSGSMASIDSFSRYTAALGECLALASDQGVNQPWYCIGQSTGGAILMDALQQGLIDSTFNIREFILLAPLLRPFAWRQTRLLFALSRLFVKATARGFSDNSHDREFLDFLRQHDALQSRIIPTDWVEAMIAYQRRFALAPVSDQVLHVIQGSADRTVDWPWNLRHIQEKFPASKSYMVADARHHLVNESVPYRERVFSLITEIIGDL